MRKNSNLGLLKDQSMQEPVDLVKIWSSERCEFLNKGLRKGYI